MNVPRVNLTKTTPEAKMPIEPIGDAAANASEQQATEPGVTEHENPEPAQQLSEKEIRKNARGAISFIGGLALLGGSTPTALTGIIAGADSLAIGGSSGMLVGGALTGWGAIRIIRSRS